MSSAGLKQKSDTMAMPAGSSEGTGTMRAVVQDAYGSADVLKIRTIPRPELEADHVLVRVCAAGLDRGVWHLMTGLPHLIRYLGFGLRAPRYRPGMDVAGTIEAVGEKVAGFSVGDEVFGICIGSFAEYAVVSPKKLALKPTGLSFAEAAVLPISAGTALQAVRDKGEVSAGQRVLVVGASGGVGVYAVQIAKSLGAEVTAVCSAAKAPMVRSLGADHTIDYRSEDFTQQDLHYDVILDIAGNRPLAKLRRVLSPTGTLVIIGGEDGGKCLGGIQRSLFASALSPFTKQRLRSFIASEKADYLRQLLDLIDAGQLRPVIDRSYALEDAAEAMRYLVDGKAQGKVVITV